jgi:hypothetical protein
MTTVTGSSGYLANFPMTAATLCDKVLEKALEKTN